MMAAMRSSIVSLLSLIALAGCTGSHTTDDAGMSCDGVVCEACTDAISLRVVLPEGGGPVTVEGVDGVACEPAGAIIYCGLRTLPAGDYNITVTADGYHPETFAFRLGLNSGTACCPCPGTFSRTLTLETLDGPDAGM